jgi:hypothetical protein
MATSERKKAYDRQYRIENRDEILANHRKYNHEHRDEINAKKKREKKMHLPRVWFCYNQTFKA